MSTRSELAFDAVGIAASEHGFVAWRYDGQVELLDGQGKRRAVVQTQIKVMSRPLPGASGWYLRGSMFYQLEEVPAVAFLSLEGRSEQPAKLPSLLWSIVEHQGKVYAGGSRGKTFVRQQTTFEPVTLDQGPVGDGDVLLQVWRDQLVPCTRGTRAKHGDQSGYCAASFGRLTGIWEIPPIACGNYLVVDTRAAGPATSPWRRQVLDQRDGLEVTRTAATGKGQLACFAGELLDTEPPGRLLKLPELSTVVESLCPSKAQELAVSGTNVMCLLQGRNIEMRSLTRE